MRKEEPGYDPALSATGHQVPPRAARSSGRHPVRGVLDCREPSHPHDDTPPDTVEAIARKRSPVAGRRGRTPVLLFSIVTPVIIMAMSVVVAIAMNKCPYSDRILDPVVLFTSVYTGGLLSIVFVNAWRKKGEPNNED